MNSEFLYSKIDSDTNMQCYVVKSTAGKFHACLKDLDSNEVIPHIAICNDLETAISKANNML